MLRSSPGLPLMLLMFLISMSACEDNTTPETNKPEETSEDFNMESPEFAEILQNAGLKGSILVFNSETGQYFSNDFAWANTGFLPASTFKIPNSIIALETGIVKDAETMFYWDGEPRGMRSWEADLSFEQAFKRSCVPCYQEIARNIGVERMNQYLENFQYGKIEVDSSNLDIFWLQGDSRITQMEQIDFLQQIVLRDLHISDSTSTVLSKLMSMEKTDSYELFGKTGWSISGDINNGWFVGYIMKADVIWYFATNVMPGEEFDMELFPQIRVQVTKEALKSLSVLPSH